MAFEIAHGFRRTGGQFVFALFAQGKDAGFGVVVMDGLMMAFMVGGSRLGVRVIGRKDRRRTSAGGKRVLIAGVRDAGRLDQAIARAAGTTQTR